MDSKKPHSLSKDIQSNIFWSEYMIAKHTYSRARKRLNRYCKRNSISYHDIELKGFKPKVWLSFINRSRQFKNARDLVTRAILNDRCLPDRHEITSHVIPAEVKRQSAFPRDPPQEDEIFVAKPIAAKFRKFEKIISSQASALDEFKIHERMFRSKEELLMNEIRDLKSLLSAANREKSNLIRYRAENEAKLLSFKNFSEITLDEYLLERSSDQNPENIPWHPPLIPYNTVWDGRNYVRIT